MPKNHARKSSARRRQQRTGAAYTSAAAGTLHQHPAPEAALIAQLPHTAGRRIDTDLASSLVGACRAGCRPCQDSLIPVALTDRALVAALAGATFGLLPIGTTGGALVSSATRAWLPLARAAHDSGEGTAALTAVLDMSEKEADDLLQDALDIWAAGGADSADIQIITAQDLGLDPDQLRALDEITPSYGVYIGTVEMPDGRPLPSLVLEPETAGAGFADLSARTNWLPWDLLNLPALDASWRLRVDIATRSLTEIVHVDRDGYDDEVLWEASETVALPQPWWDLLDRVQHVLVQGPGSAELSEQLQAAQAESGQLLAVVARVSFS